MLVMMTVVLLQTAKVNPLEKKITFPQFIEAVKKNQVEAVTYKERGRISGRFKSEYENGAVFETVGDTTSEFYTKLLGEHSLTPNYEIDGGNTLLVQLLISWGPMVVLGVLLIYKL